MYFFPLDALFITIIRNNNNKMGLKFIRRRYYGCTFLRVNQKGRKIIIIMFFLVMCFGRDFSSPPRVRVILFFVGHHECDRNLLLIIKSWLLRWVIIIIKLFNGVSVSGPCMDGCKVKPFFVTPVRDRCRCGKCYLYMCLSEWDRVICIILKLYDKNMVLFIRRVLKWLLYV